MTLDNNTRAFFELVRAGLWEKEVRLAPFGEIDFTEILRLAEEQSVVGLVAAGLEHVTDTKPAKKDVLQFIGQSLQLEQHNNAMNHYIRVLIEQLRDNGIYAVLIKGQGVAQCYKRPLWRACGDIDLLLDETNYEKAKQFLVPLADSVDKEFVDFKHLGMSIGAWVVELHGTLHCRLSKRIDRTIDEVQDRVFCQGEVRTWHNEDMDVFLPSANSDIIFLFTHILKHFYQGGIGLRQICDLCRFVWTYKGNIEKELFEKKLNEMGIRAEWKAFAAYMVDMLGMPAKAIPFYSSDKKWSRKAKAINRFVLEVGNFGHNRDSYNSKKHSFVIGKAISLWWRTRDSFRHFFIFPWNSIKAWWTVLVTGIKLV